MKNQLFGEVTVYEGKLVNYFRSQIRSKKDSHRSAVFFREGISFLWGIAKNYIMYWGVTSSILAYPLSVYNTKDSQILHVRILIFSIFAQLLLFSYPLSRFFGLRIVSIKELPRLGTVVLFLVQQKLRT